MEVFKRRSSLGGLELKRKEIESGDKFCDLILVKMRVVDQKAIQTADGRPFEGLPTIEALQ